MIDNVVLNENIANKSKSELIDLCLIKDCIIAIKEKKEEIYKQLIEDYKKTIEELTQKLEENQRIN